MAASRKVDHTGMPAPAKEAKPVHTVRFQEGIEDHLEAKARGDRSRLYFKDGKPYVHPPRKLLEGTAVYRCKILGSMIVAQSQGTNLIREVVDRLQLVGEARKGAVAKKVVDLGINTRSLYIKDVGRKVILTHHPLHQISYCAADRRYDNVFAYIIKHTKKDKPTICYVYETMDAEASEIAATVGQAFQLAYNRFEDAKAAQLGFKDMKDKLISDLDKLEFSKQVTELQKQVQEMEAEADAKDRPPKDETTEKFPEVEPKWDSITNALDPYNTKPSLDPDSQYMVPRPETAELDGVIQNIEEQLGELQEAFSDQWFLLERLTAREREAGLAKNVMETIDSQVKDMLVNILIGSIWS
ncbi:PTB domain-containing engulfment adapter protein 1 [Geodia barretti]|uniref:PTB domain-containing engulfment adapter protein 1 n=1 Tax=Geodia barretti TaxID=519541 RepID=A0AA35REI7_GEOBA|nr:PTB domain-containing engulfment adapter protein 1 [Geodia barretti]